MTKRALLLRLAALAMAAGLHFLMLMLAGSGGGGAPPPGEYFELVPTVRVVVPPPPLVVIRPQVTLPDAPIVVAEKESEPEQTPDEPLLEMPQEPSEQATPAADEAAEASDTGESSLAANGAESDGPAAGAGSGPGGGDGARSFLPIYQVDVRPEMRRQAPLVYPESARRQNREGTVVIELDLTETAQIAAARIVRSAGSDFDAAALAMLQASDFTPARVGNQPVSVKARFTINFRLKD